MDAIAEVGPGGHYLGCGHTQRNYATAFWKSEVLDYRPFETWSDDGAADTEALAAARVDRLLAQYEQPPMDEATGEALAAYVARRKAEMPDAFG